MEKNVSTELASNTTSKGYRNTMPVRRYTGFNFSQTSGVNQFRQTGHIFDHCSMVSRYKVHKKLIYLRGPSQMTPAYFWSFLTPPPPLSALVRIWTPPLSDDVRSVHTPPFRKNFTKLYISNKYNNYNHKSIKKFSIYLIQWLRFSCFTYM